MRMKKPEMVRVLMMNVLIHHVRWGNVRVMARSMSPAGRARRVAPVSGYSGGRKLRVR